LASDGQPLSYPFGEARTAVRRPALSEFRAACAQAKVALRVVVLWRDPLACTLSRIKAMSQLLQGHALLQARIVDAELQRLSFETSQLPCGSVAVASYEALLGDPAGVARQLAIFAGLEPDGLVSRARAAINPPPAASVSNWGHDVAFSAQQLEGLKAYFGYPASAGAMGSSSSSRSSSGGSVNAAGLGDTTSRAKGWGSLLVPLVSLAQVAADAAAGPVFPGAGSKRGASEGVCCAVGQRVSGSEEAGTRR
jgi:hypothetical protein